jgi:hypothetical protein
MPRPTGLALAGFRRHSVYWESGPPTVTQATFRAEAGRATALDRDSPVHLV